MSTTEQEILNTFNKENVGGYHNNYLFVFMIVGMITLIPLIIITSIVLLKSNMTKPCQLILLSMCLALCSGVGAMVLLQFALGPQQLILTRGDQILIGEPNDGYLVSLHELRSLVCSHFVVESDRLRIMVWTSMIAPHRGSEQNYSLVFKNLSLPYYLRLRLQPGDQMVARNFTLPTRLNILKGSHELKKWTEMGVYKPGYEKCCSWKVMDNLEDESKDNRVQIEEDDMYTIIMRKKMPQQADSVVNNQTIFSGQLEFKRSRWTPNPCDSVLCEGSTMKCDLKNSPRRFVIDYAVETMTAPNYDLAHVQLICHPRHWALGLMFSSIPIIIIILTLTTWGYRIRQKKQLKFNDTELNTNRYYNQHGNPTFEFDLV